MLGKEGREEDGRKGGRGAKKEGGKAGREGERKRRKFILAGP